MGNKKHANDTHDEFLSICHLKPVKENYVKSMVLYNSIEYISEI